MNWDIVNGPPNKGAIVLDGDACTWRKGLMYGIRLVT